jgi:hypothetical protein
MSHRTILAPALLLPLLGVSLAFLGVTLALRLFELTPWLHRRIEEGSAQALFLTFFPGIALGTAIAWGAWRLRPAGQPSLPWSLLVPGALLLALLLSFAGSLSRLVVPLALRGYPLPLSQAISGWWPDPGLGFGFLLQGVLGSEYDVALGVFFGIILGYRLRR